MNVLKIIKICLFIFLSGFTLLLFNNPSIAQVNPCTPNTPSYTLDLSGNPNGTWVSAPPIVRAGSCCGSVWPDRCIVFLITLDSAAVAINFEIISGAVPGGSMFYQIDCGPPVTVGEPICLNGPGPYALSFCKPGNNLNTYAITSIAGPSIPPDDTTGIGCDLTLSTIGLDPASVTWSDITSGTGLYNSYLSCTSGCSVTVVTPTPPAPPYVDYEVCGAPVTPICMPPAPFCDTVRIYITPELLVSVSPDPAVYCENFSGVQLYGNVTGGDGNYSYTWTNSYGTEVGDSLNYFAGSPGTYVLEVQDGNYPDCPAGFDTVTVIEQPLPEIDAGSDITICENITTISLNGTVTNAAGGIWSGGAGTFNPNNTTINTIYTPGASEITDGYVILTLTSTGNGICPAATDQIYIMFSSALNLSIIAPPIICYGDTATITANTTGGLPPLTYYWNTGDSTQSITAPAGTYFVSVSDAGLFPCMETATVTIQQNPLLTVTASPNDSTNCNTIIDISVSASGGSGNYTYWWSNGQTSTSISVTPGSYSVIVTDGSGCTATDSVSVTATNSTISATISQPGNLCYGSVTQISVTASGGTGFYSYLWDNGATTSSTVVGSGTYCALVTDMTNCWTTTCINVNENPVLTAEVFATSPTCVGANIPIIASATGGQATYSYLWSTGQSTQTIYQPAGTYTVYVIDANSCTDTASVTVTNEPNINTTVISAGVSCFNGNDGSATVTVSGGIPPYYYSWAPWGGVSATATSLIAGTYIVIVTDSLGCSEVIPVLITQPAAIFASVSSFSGPCCYGGSDGTATVGVSGGTPAYSYSWSPTGGSGQTATGLSENTYTVTVTDSNGCSNTASITITDPDLLNATISGTNVSCSGGSDGSITVNASGGTPPYSYIWTPNVSTTSTAANLSAGNYSVTITDAQGCLTADSITVIELPGIVVNVSNIVDVSCFGGSDGGATAIVSGGTMPFSYLWTPGGETTAATGNLSTGSYDVTVTDSNGCQGVVSVSINQPPLLVVTSPDQSILCDNTVSLTVTPGGGTPDYSYLWSTGETTDTIYSNTPGIYNITVTDAQGCIASDTVIVTATNSILAAVIVAPPSICYGSTTNIIVNVTGAGGAGGCTYIWSTGDTTSSITAGSGTYCVTVTDGVNCSVTTCVNVIENDPLVIDIIPDTICYNSTAILTADVSGGLAPYEYFWSTGDTTVNIIDSAGTYSVSVTDAIGCSAVTNATVIENPEMVIAFTDIWNVSCLGGSNGSVTAIVSVGVPGFTYSWSPVAATDPDIYGLSAGTYTVTVTDILGCVGSNSITITEPTTVLMLDSISGNNISCYGNNTGSATVSASGGTAPYNYLWWVTGDTIPSVSGLPAGSYGVSAADSNGCIATNTIIISQPALLSVNMNGINNVSCTGGSDASVTAQVSGGIPPYTYLWSPGGSTDSSLTGVIAGFYEVTVADANLCTAGANVTITEPPPISTTVSGTTAICYGQNTTISASANGGNGYFTYLWDQGLGTGAVQIVNPTTTTTYTVIITDGNGCSNTALPVTVSVSSPLSLILTAPDTICEGDSASVFVSVSGGDGNYSYIWSDPGFGNSAGPHYVTPSTTTTYTVIILDSCSTPAVTESITIVVSPYPEAIINANPSEGCVTLNVNFSANTTGNPNGTGYLWTFDDGSTSTSVSASQTYSQNGTYTVSLTAWSSFGCSVTSTANGDINVFQTAIADFSVDPPVTSILSPTVDFIDNSQNTTTWLWDFGDGDTSILTNPQHTYEDTGMFLVQLVVNNQFDCPDTLTQWVSIEPDFAYFIPNAFIPDGKGGNKSFIGKGHCITEFEMFIYNRWGDLIYETTDVSKPWDGRANNGKELAQQDVYVYLFRVWDCLHEMHVYVGHVTLIR
ncbi:MAG: PKD domain-containing protein [Bacteroidota bacterium]